MHSHGRIAIENIEQAVAVIGPEFLNTPQFECEPLSAALGARIVLKVETINPIRSFKGRGAELTLSKLPAGAEVVCASAGNFGQAIAYSARIQTWVGRRAIMSISMRAPRARPVTPTQVRAGRRAAGKYSAYTRFIGT